MNASPRTNTVPLIIFTVAPPTSLVADLRNMTATEEYDQLPEIVKDQYAWYTPEHKRVALQYTTALVHSSQMSLPRQVALNAQQVIYFLTKDLAERTHALAHYRMGYKGEITCRQYSIVAGRTFRDPVEITADRRVDWVFDPIEQFAKRIPLDALKAIKRLADARIVPEAYWVADKIETVIPKPVAAPVAPAPISRSVDPILCAQFGNWLVGIAWWL